MRQRHSAPLHTPYYCEENVWHLCQHTSVVGEERHVLWMTNSRQRCTFRFQRAAAQPGAAVVWDYHTVLISRTETWMVWDLDHVLGFPVSLRDYLDASFGRVPARTERFACRFRVIPADAYVERFSSNRSHMLRPDGSWMAPPPEWPVIDHANPAIFRELLDTSSSVLAPLITRQELERRFFGEEDLN